MIEPNFECGMCGRDLMETSIPFKFVIIDGKTENICRFCSNKHTPDEIKSVEVMAKLEDSKTIIKEYDIVLFLNNQFTEKDIEDYKPYDEGKLTKYLRKLLDIKNEYVVFILSIKLVKKRCNKCELCDKLLDFEESIYFKTGKKGFIQVCKECEKQ